jgi:hypothetical protein
MLKATEELALLAGLHGHGATYWPPFANDPGVIATFSNFGITLPGFLAAAVGADGPEFVP